MKTASVLFGLVTTACAASAPAPTYPLCDGEGAPACGNIGQVGRTTPVASPVVEAVVVTTPEPRIERREITGGPIGRVVPVVNVLLGAFAHESSTTPFARPLVDNREQVTCGNVMSKGGSRRICRDGSGTVVSNSWDDDSGDE